MVIQCSSQSKKYGIRDLLAAALAFISIFAVISGISLTRQLSASLDETSAEHLQALTAQWADIEARRIEAEISNVQRFADWIVERPTENIKAAADLFPWDYISVTDQDGQILFENGTAVSSVSEDSSRSVTEHFLSDEGTVCSVYTGGSGEPVFAVQVPIVNDGIQDGELYVEYGSQELLSNCFTELEKDGSFFCLSDERGNILFQKGIIPDETADYGNIFRIVRELAQENMFHLFGNSHKNDVKEFLQNSFGMKDSGNVWITIGEKEYILCYESVPDGHSWYIITLQPSTYPESLSKYVTAYLFIICGLILLVALISIFIWGTRMKSKYEICAMEAELDHANVANKAKSDFLSSMSHELRTPMNAIVGITALANRSADDPKKTREYLHKLEISTTYMLSLINDILDMSRIERGKVILYRITFDLYDLIEAVDAMIRQITSEKSQKFDVSVSVTHNYIVCDKARFQQIIVNMLNNAVKYTKEGGSIRLTVEERSVSDGKVSLYVEVADTGIGIRKEDQQRIFEPFEEASDKDVSGASGAYGTGLGLSISQNLLKMMGSEMRVFSVPGKGSVFSFEIELDYVQESDAFLPKVHYGNWDLKGRRMLIAEDNDMNRDMLMELLDGEGIICDPARDGECALEMFQKSAPGTYDAVLMDIQMPHMDGLEATKMIRSSNHEDAGNVPIVAMTAYAFTEDIERSINAGMSAYTSKPVDIRELCKLLNKLITERGKCA